MRHLRWIVPVAVGVVLFVVPMTVVLRLGSRPEPTPGESLLILGMAALWFVGPLVCLVVTIVQAVRVQGEARRRRAERRDLEVLGQTPDGVAHWQRAAADLRAQLIAGRTPPAIAVWPLTLRPGETACYDVTARYSRFYGTSTSYQRNSTLAFGRPGFVAVAVAATEIGNHRRRAAAQRMGTAQWRETQLTRVVVTDQRVVCDLGGQWLTFDYSAMTAIWPDIGGNAFVAAFDGVEPLLLAGPAADVVSVLAVHAQHGPAGLREHPALQELAGPGRPAPAVGPGREAGGAPADGDRHAATGRRGEAPGRGTHPSIFDT